MRIASKATAEDLEKVITLAPSVDAGSAMLYAQAGLKLSGPTAVRTVKTKAAVKIPRDFCLSAGRVGPSSSRANGVASRSQSACPLTPSSSTKPTGIRAGGTPRSPTNWRRTVVGDRPRRPRTHAHLTNGESWRTRKSGKTCEETPTVKRTPGVRGVNGAGTGQRSQPQQTDENELSMKKSTWAPHVPQAALRHRFSTTNGTRERDL